MIELAEYKYIINDQYIDRESLINEITNNILEQLIQQGTELIQPIQIIDNLNSNSSTNALSANMGRYIKTNIQELMANVYNNIIDNLNDPENPNNKYLFLSANLGYQLNERIKKLEATAAGGGSINSNFPKGAIVMWSGNINNIPQGWALCDGEDGRPNLYDKFIKGITNNITNPGTIGGAHERSLTVDNLPQHTHNIVHTHTTQNHAHLNNHHHTLSNSMCEANGSHTHEFINEQSQWYSCLYKTNNIIAVKHDNTGDHIIPAAKKKINNTNNDYVFSSETKSSVEHVHNVRGHTDKNCQAA